MKKMAVICVLLVLMVPAILYLTVCLVARQAVIATIRAQAPDLVVTRLGWPLWYYRGYPNCWFKLFFQINKPESGGYPDALAGYFLPTCDTSFELVPHVVDPPDKAPKEIDLSLIPIRTRTVPKKPALPPSPGE